MKPLVKTTFKEISLDDMLSQIGEDKTKNILSSFVCPQNKDVEFFLHDKAILFSHMESTKTFLVYWHAEESEFEPERKEFVGYYTIGNKPFTIPRETLSGKMSSKKWRELCRIANTRSNEDKCILSAYLIGQLGKNFDHSNNLLISGNDLLALALNKIMQIQKLQGGKVVYVECEDKKKLLDFYESNGFQIVGKRTLDKDETGLKGTYLMQLYKYL